MKCLPYAVRMRIEDGERTKVRLWLPVFLLWPLFLVLLVLGLLLALIVDLFTALSGRRPGYSRLLIGCFEVMGETSGTEVFIQDRSRSGRTVAFRVR